MNKKVLTAVIGVIVIAVLGGFIYYFQGGNLQGFMKFPNPIGQGQKQPIVEDAVYLRMSPETENVILPYTVSVEAGDLSGNGGSLQLNPIYRGDATKVSVSIEDSKGTQTGKNVALGGSIKVYPSYSNKNEYYIFKVENIRIEPDGLQIATFSVKHYR